MKWTVFISFLRWKPHLFINKNISSERQVAFSRDEAFDFFGYFRPSFFPKIKKETLEKIETFSKFPTPMYFFYFSLCASILDAPRLLKTFHAIYSTLIWLILERERERKVFARKICNYTFRFMVFLPPCSDYRFIPSFSPSTIFFFVWKMLIFMIKQGRSDGAVFFSPDFYWMLRARRNGRIFFFSSPKSNVK